MISQVGNYGVGGSYVMHMDRNHKQDVEYFRTNSTYPGDSVASTLIALQTPNAGIPSYLFITPSGKFFVFRIVIVICEQ